MKIEDISRRKVKSPAKIGRITPADVSKAIKAVKQYKAPVIPLGGVTRLNLPPDRILEGAKGKLESVLIMGQQDNGEWYFASSVADGGTVLWMMEKLKLLLMGLE